MDNRASAGKTIYSGIPRDLRIAALAALASAVLFSFQILTINQDEASQFSKYPTAAVKWLDGTIVPERITDYSPLYLWLHAAAHRFLNEPLLWIHLLHILLLSLTASLLYLILRRHCSTIIAVSGVAAFVLSKSIIIYGYIFEPEPVMILLLTAVVFFADRKDMPGTIAAGVSTALCLLTRPTFAPLILIIPIYYWLHSADRKLLLRSLVLFLTPVLLVLICISIRNYNLQQNFSPLGMNPALRFFDGNNPLSQGNRAAYPPLVNDVAARSVGESDYEYAVYRQFARRSAGQDLPVADTERYWASKTRAFIADHPAHFLALTARRVLYLIHGHRWHDLDPAWLTDRVLGGHVAPFVPFSLVSALALAGMVVGLASWRQNLLSYLVVAIQAGFMGLIYATDRQRVSLYPFFIFFAVIALSELKERGRGRRYMLAAVVLLTVLLSVPYDRMKDDRHIGEGAVRYNDLLDRSFRAREHVDLAGSLTSAAQAFALSPRSNDRVWPSELPGGSRGLAEAALRELPLLRRPGPSTDLDRALLLIDAGRLDEAETVLGTLARARHAYLRDGDGLPEPLYHLGRIAVRRGQKDRSTEFLVRALEKHPGDPLLLSSLACLTGEKTYADRIFRYFDTVDAEFYLGRACLETGSPDKSLFHLRRLDALLPGNPRVRIHLAAALSASGDYAGAAALYRAGAGEKPPMVMFEDQVLTAFRMESGSGAAEDLYWYGIVLRHYGRLPEALQALQKAAFRGYPGAAPSAREVEIMLGRSSAKRH